MAAPWHVHKVDFIGGETPEQFSQKCANLNIALDTQGRDLLSGGTDGWEQTIVQVIGDDTYVWFGQTCPVDAKLTALARLMNSYEQNALVSTTGYSDIARIQAAYDMMHSQAVAWLSDDRNVADSRIRGHIQGLVPRMVLELLRLDGYIVYDI